jgi:hypothetical protein
LNVFLGNHLPRVRSIGYDDADIRLDGGGVHRYLYAVGARRGLRTGNAQQHRRGLRDSAWYARQWPRQYGKVKQTYQYNNQRDEHNISFLTQIFHLPSLIMPL